MEKFEIKGHTIVLYQCQ